MGCLETVLPKTLIGMWGIVVASYVCRGSQSKFPGPFNAPHHYACVTTCPLDFSDDSLLRVLFKKGGKSHELVCFFIEILYRILQKILG